MCHTVLAIIKNASDYYMDAPKCHLRSNIGGNGLGCREASCLTENRIKLTIKFEINSIR